MLTGLRLAPNGLICTSCEAWRSASHHFIAGRGPRIHGVPDHNSPCQSGVRGPVGAVVIGR
jgi:hypothetical protein